MIKSHQIILQKYKHQTISIRNWQEPILSMWQYYNEASQRNNEEIDTINQLYVDDTAILKYRRRSKADQSPTNNNIMKAIFSGNNSEELNKLFKIHARHLKSFNLRKAPSNLYFAKSLLDQQKMSSIDVKTILAHLKNTKANRDSLSFSNLEKSWCFVPGRQKVNIFWHSKLLNCKEAWKISLR